MEQNQELLNRMKQNQGLLSGVRYRPSPYCDARPDNVEIDMIVIHGISLPPGQFGTGAVERFFCGDLDRREHPYYETIAHLHVSAHLFIDRQGVVYQFVPLIKRAWHAGISCFQGRERCNDFSIGIELEGTDYLPYEKIQYAQLARTITLLQTVYPAMTRERIVGHSDIAPGRKQDPGPFFSWTILDEWLYLTQA
jgi:N-acetyl-anhydromuramoyl-L-alanine amidase